MKLLHLLRRPAVVDRERLTAAIAARDAAHQAVIDARATLARLLVVVDEADDAARVAADAAQKVKATRAAWVNAGCPYSGTREIQTLEAAAAEAARNAERAALNADPVRKELARAEDAVKSRQSGVAHRDQDIAATIGVILVEEAAVDIAQFLALAAEFRNARLRIHALAQLVNPWSRDRDAHCASEDAHRSVEAVLKRGAVRGWNDEIDSYSDGGPALFEQLNQRMALLRDRAKALLGGAE